MLEKTVQNEIARREKEHQRHGQQGSGKEKEHFSA